MKNPLFHKILAVAFLFIQTILIAQNSRVSPQIISIKNLEKEISLDQKYKVSKEDKAIFANPAFDDTSWQSIDISKDSIFQDRKIYWLRYYVKADSSVKNVPLNLEIFQKGASEVYLNGNKIKNLGKIGEDKTGKYIAKDNNPLILQLANSETNVIAIRFQPYLYNDVGLIKFQFKNGALALTLNNADLFVKNKLQEVEKFNFFSMLICGIFLALGFIHLLLFLFYRKALYNLFFSLYNLSIGAMSYIVLLFYNIKDLTKQEHYIYLFFIAFLVFGFSLTGFVNNLFGKSKIRSRIMLAIPVIIIIVYEMNPDLSVIISVFYITLVGFETVYLIIRAMIRRKRSAFIVGGGILLFFIFIVYRIIINLLNIEFSLSNDLTSIFSIVLLISFPASISAYLAWEFANTNLNLVNQLGEVNRLSEINFKQEQEKQQILQNQNDLLEKQVDERTQELQIEKQKTEDLLLNILPEEVAEELKQKGSSEAKQYDEVSVLFTDFVNFTVNLEKIGVQEVIAELNVCFTEFDQIMGRHNLEKIKTIGDAYLAVSGLPVSDDQHAENAINAALEILEFTKNRKLKNPDALDIRIGIHSGPVIAGIVGVRKFA
ncbi:class 3 adenylate cyclase [Chryseobacterium sp. 16F]|uniref:Class 3 adenylate cyclase n=1 Tax=Frigoriflavimonas asaccharolytica TaxID=2735899 RepID=A0A8J8K9X7_9FLAO|nr:class 3 adenylate cyclase [Frigoriflavimonas asaccharolytica]